jgi:uncharacterized membrane protein
MTKARLKPVSISSVLALIVFSVFVVPLSAYAQSSLPSTGNPATAAAPGTVMMVQTTVIKAQVVAVLSDQEEILPGTNVPTEDQKLEVKLLAGPKAGQIITVDNNYVHFNKGDLLFLDDTLRGDNGQEFYAVEDADRLPTIYLFTGLFIILVLLIGGFQGLRGLLSLAGSFLLIIFVLIPGILHGFSPVIVSIVVASFIIILGSYITHGFNKTTSSAVIGMILTVVVTGLLAFLAVHSAKLTGFENEEATYLNLNTGGNINLIGVLLGGIVIGVLGVLYDVAIGQAISVEELHNIAPHIPRATIFRRAIRIGREHIGALVNTLAIAYVGASLPLLLLFSQSANSISVTINREIFSTEIIRTLIGSIGLVMAVPITTLLAVLMIVKVKKVSEQEEIGADIVERERQALLHAGYHH